MNDLKFGPPHAVFNLSKIGLRYFRIGIKSSDSSKEKLINHFKGHPNVGWIFLAKGWFNLAIGIWAKDNSEINDISSQIRSILSKKDEIVFQSELTSLYGFGNRPITKNNNPMCIVDSVMDPTELLPVELDYIKLLALDSSINKEELSQILNVSKSELDSIHEKMLSTGIITGFQERINYDGIYFKVFVDTLSRKNESSVSDLIKELWNDHSCIYFEKANSKYDLEFELILNKKSDIKKYIRNFRDYKIAIMTENLYTNLYPLNKIANLKEIKDTLKNKNGNVVDFRNSKLWYLNYKGTDAYLSIYENRKYFETMEKSELDLFDDITSYIKSNHGEKLYSIIDIGSGDGLKGRIFIEKLGESNVKAYYPVDIQPIELATTLKSHKDGVYAKHPTVLDFENLNTRFPIKLLPDELQVEIFCGGTYGNFFHEKINSYLKPFFDNDNNVLVVTMPIVTKDKTEDEIRDSYRNMKVENFIFGPLAQVGFDKKDFELNPEDKDLIVQVTIENKCLICFVVLKNQVEVRKNKFEKGTIFKMTTSWKPTIEEFQKTLELSFKVKKMFSNKDMAIAIVEEVKGLNK